MPAIQTTLARRLRRGTLLALLASALLPALPAAAANEGFLYGRIETREGKTYEGRLRWDDEEAFWGDYFNSAKEENKWIDEAPRGERERHRKTIEVFGVRVGTISDDVDESRQFTARFGDIQKLEPDGGDDVIVTMKSGTRFELDGGSNDVEAKIRVWDSGLGVVAVPWRQIRSIAFLETPSIAVAPRRLFGTVHTRVGDFTGYVQWDQEECLAGDELDGETDDDGDMSIEMGNIRTIERRSSRSSTVVLNDGRQVVLADTNDVDNSNRGIYVEDNRFGRVLVSWKAFEKVDFRDGGSGPSYRDYPPGEPLAGLVTTVDGRRLSGRLVYDLDEAETTEMLDGESRDVEYSIPFTLVASVQPQGERSMVVLHSGEKLELEDTVDVNEQNAGMLVFESGKPHPTYVRWEDVERVDFSKPTSSYPPIK